MDQDILSQIYHGGAKGVKKHKRKPKAKKRVKKVHKKARALAIGPKKLRDLKMQSGFYKEHVSKTGRHTLKLKAGYTSKDFRSWVGQGVQGIEGGYIQSGAGQLGGKRKRGKGILGGRRKRGGAENGLVGGKRKLSEWQLLVKKVMKERGCSLPEASKIAKSMY